LIGLKKQFAIMDTDSSGALSLNEFLHAVESYRVPDLNQADAEKLFSVFDKSGDG